LIVWKLLAEVLAGVAMIAIGEHDSRSHRGQRCAAEKGREAAERPSARDSAGHAAGEIVQPVFHR